MEKCEGGIKERTICKKMGRKRKGRGMRKRTGSRRETNTSFQHSDTDGYFVVFKT